MIGTKVPKKVQVRRAAEAEAAEAEAAEAEAAEAEAETAEAETAEAEVEAAEAEVKEVLQVGVPFITDLRQGGETGTYTRTRKFPMIYTALKGLRFMKELK